MILIIGLKKSDDYLGFADFLINYVYNVDKQSNKLTNMR